MVKKVIKGATVEIPARTYWVAGKKIRTKAKKIKLPDRKAK